jgi:hypothetical protein
MKKNRWQVAPKTKNCLQWIRSLNGFIKLAVPKFNLNLSSHSFRVNYITSLLRSTPIERVSKIIGHADIRTTCRYDRYIIDEESLQEKLSNLE